MKVQRSGSSDISGSWAKAKEDIFDQDILTLVDAGQLDESGSYGARHVFKVKVKSGEEKNLSFNKSSLNNVIEAYGEDTELWVGKKVKAYVVKQMVGDGMKNVIYLIGSGFALDDEGRLVRTKPKEEEIPVINLEEEKDETEIKISDIPF